MEKEKAGHADTPCGRRGRVLGGAVRVLVPSTPGGGRRRTESRKRPRACSGHDIFDEKVKSLEGSH